MKTAAVVGATGYVGSHVVQALLARGYHVRCSSRHPDKAEWLKSLPKGQGQGRISIHLLNLGTAGPNDPSQLDAILRGGCSSVFFCAGFEKQDPSTIDFMVENALSVVRAARKHQVGCVVLTSSGGSTNPAGLTNDTPKREHEHWSDPEAQKARGKFSPAAKTLMELSALAEVGRDRHNAVVDAVRADGAPRLCIMNPNLILGPQLQPGKISGNSLPWVVRILKGEAMNKQIPNDSMSIIDVRDLATLHVSCAENESASGRYFGVNRSWPWREILGSFSRVCPGYEPPPSFEGAANTPTQFDSSRRDSLGVVLRPLDDTLADLVAFLRERGALP